MNFLTRHIEELVKEYQGTFPLASFLRIYCKRHPRLGSRDRKALAEAAYLYYRYARRLPEATTVLEVVREAVRHADTPGVFLKKMLPASEAPSIPLLPGSASLSVAFSEGIRPADWFESLLKQPLLFIRSRNNTARLLTLLQEAGLTPLKLPNDLPGDTRCLGLPNGTPLEQQLPASSYVVQDWASQKSMAPVLRFATVRPPENVWDVCAGAGGKSLLLKEQFPEASLLVSDIRSSILENLAGRFLLYGLEAPKAAVLDVTHASALTTQLGAARFDLILCDVPCSGSGTWARTPEQFHFFVPGHLEKFKALQYPIAFNASAYLKPGGIFAYITCSVFHEENEAVVRRLLATTDLQLLHQELINGIPHLADNLFVAVFRKPASPAGPPSEKVPA